MTVLQNVFENAGERMETVELTRRKKAKLNSEQVRKIRHSTESGVELSKKFGVTAACVSLIRKRKRRAKLSA
jgi:hypothetical protein